MTRTTAHRTTNTAASGLPSSRRPKSLESGYFTIKNVASGDRDSLRLELAFARGESAKSKDVGFDLAGFSVGEDGVVAKQIDYAFYGEDGYTRGAYSDSAHAAGALIVVNDEKRGIIVLDAEADKIVNGPEMPVIAKLLDGDDFKKDAGVRAFAKAGGINLRDLEVSVSSVKFELSSDNHKIAGLQVGLRLRDDETTQIGVFNVPLKGDPARGLGALQLGKIQPGESTLHHFVMPKPGVRSRLDVVV